MKKLLTVLAAFLLLLAGLGAQALERPPAVAGQFYPADPKALVALVDRCLESVPKASLGEVVAILVPHAGLEFSGPTAARAYRLLAPGRWDSVVVIGSGHYREVAGAAIYPGDYATPEGSVPYDEALARELLKSSPLFALDPEAHAREHSIEVQIPFLRRRLKGFKIVAMVMNTQDLETQRAVGQALARVLRGRRVLLVASSDQSHYPGPQDADAVDRTTLEALSTLDPAYFWLTNRLLMRRGIERLAVSYCGEGAVAAVAEAARALGANELRLLGHANSADVPAGKGLDRVVGYAAAAFVKNPKHKLKPVLELAAPEKKELLGLARRSIEEHLSSGKTPEIGLSANPRFNLPAAVFVTLRKNGDLRGCIGSLSPQESLLESVARNAVAAAVADRRFQPLSRAELPGVSIEISILSQARPVRGPREVRPGDGVILEQGGHSGVFLPQVWEQLKDKESFLSELCSQKAGLPRDCARDPETRLKVFSVDLFEEGH